MRFSGKGNGVWRSSDLWFLFIFSSWFGDFVIPLIGSTSNESPFGIRLEELNRLEAPLLLWKSVSYIISAFCSITIIQNTLQCSLICYFHSYLTITALSLSEGNSLPLYSPLLIPGFEVPVSGWDIFDPTNTGDVNDRFLEGYFVLFCSDNLLNWPVGLDS